MAKRRKTNRPFTVAAALHGIGACEEAIVWSRPYGRDWAKAWRECKRLDWLYHIPVSSEVPSGPRTDAMVEADGRGIVASRDADDHCRTCEWDETGGPKSCAAYRKHVKWGKHIKPVLREMGWL